MKNGFLAVFESTTETLKAERALKEAGLKPRPVIKPRKLGGSCQMVLKLPFGSFEAVGKAVSERRLKLVGFFVQDDDDGWIPMADEPDC